MQDVEALELWLAVTRDQRVGIERDRLGAAVDDLVAECEQILVVDRDGATELKSFAVVEDERDGAADAEGAGAFLLPDGFAVGEFHVGAGSGDPAELGVERHRAARGREQDDRRRFRVDGFAVLQEREVVDAGAPQPDRAAHRWGVDADTGRRRQGVFAGRKLAGGGPGRLLNGGWARRLLGHRAWLRRGAGLLHGPGLLHRAGLRRGLGLLLRLFLALGFHLRQAKKDLPSNQHNG